MGSPSEGDIIKCPICLEKIEPGQGEAIFTAECSHSFHFTCISNNIEHKNYNCPLCRARWNNLPRVHRIRNPNNNRTILEGFLQNPIHFSYQPNPYTSRFDSSEDLTFSLPPSSSSPTNVSISASPERSAVSSLLSLPRFSVLVEMKAPSSSVREPIDLVLVLDTSRSMEGDKLTLLKWAVTFVIDNLGPTDRISVVSFSTSAHIIFPLSRASDQGVREFVKRKVDGLHARGKTNIVEGLKKGVEAITARRDTSVSSIMLLSDGIDTCHSHYSSFDYTSGPNSYLHLLPSSIRRSSDTNTETTLIPVHAFGLGSEHDPLAMGLIAHGSGGTFSFVEPHELSIRDAFASRMGGLLSVAVRDLRLVLRSASLGVEIRSIELGRHIGTISDDRSEGVIDIGDLCVDEEKVFLIDLSVPKPANTNEMRTDLLSIACSYLGSVSRGTETIEAGPVWINRPAIPSFEENAVNPRVDRERTRLSALRSISEAEVGDLGGGTRTLMWGRGVRIVDLDSWRSDDDASHSLEAEIRELDHRMRSFSVTFERGGRGMSSRRSQRATARWPGSRSGRGGGSVTSQFSDA